MFSLTCYWVNLFIMLVKQNLKLLLFCITKVPLIFFCFPRLILLTSSSCHIKIPLNYFTKNHVSSMYFGALLIGVDLCVGLLALDLIQQSKYKIGIIFKDVKAEFLKRAENSVRFECESGAQIQSMIESAISSKERVTESIEVVAYDIKTNECVVKYSIGLSIKAK